jgi:succinate-acetate transporter protein
MSKIIFQVGLLAFCISTVVFSIYGSPLLEVIAKSFIIFIAAVIGMIAIIFASSALSEREKSLDQTENSEKTA